MSLGWSGLPARQAARLSSPKSSPSSLALALERHLTNSEAGRAICGSLSCASGVHSSVFKNFDNAKKEQGGFQEQERQFHGDFQHLSYRQQTEKEAAHESQKNGS